MMDAIFFQAMRSFQYRTREFPGKWRIQRRLSSMAKRIKFPNEALTRIPDGILLSLDTRDFLQREIYLFGSWENHVSRILETLLHTNDVFVDIGANIGYHAIHAARHVGPSGRGIIRLT